MSLFIFKERQIGFLIKLNSYIGFLLSIFILKLKYIRFEQTNTNSKFCDKKSVFVDLELVV